MSFHPTPSEHNAEETAHYREVLRKLVDMGLDMAANLHKQDAQPPTKDTPKPDLTIPYDRIARAIRRSILLAQKLAEPAHPKTDHVAARKRIIREVEDQIERHSYRESVDPDALRVELGDRLDSPDLAPHLAKDLDTLPLDQIIIDLCSDLGVGKMPDARINQWRRRTPADITDLIRRATPPHVSWNAQPHPA